MWCRRHHVLWLHGIAPIPKVLPRSLQSDIISGGTQSSFNGIFVSCQQWIDTKGRSKASRVRCSLGFPVHFLVRIKWNVCHDAAARRRHEYTCRSYEINKTIVYLRIFDTRVCKDVFAEPFCSLHSVVAKGGIESSNCLQVASFPFFM